MDKNEIVQVIVNCNEYHKKEIEKLGRIKYELPIINAFAVEIKNDALVKLKSMDGIIKIENDHCLTAQSDRVKQENHLKQKEYSKNYGTGIGVAVLDTGIYPHKDFGKPSRLIAFKDFINDHDYAYDDNGHGTHVAGIIGGNGSESDGKYTGIAPDVNLIGVKVLGKDGSGNLSDVLAGIQWVFDHKDKYNIRIINLSVGMTDIEGETSILVKGVETAWDHGFFVICAAGNNGPSKSTITTPGISKKVITVGSFDDEEDKASAKAAAYSSRGPTKNCVIKPEVVAPGSKIVSCSSDIEYVGKQQIEHKENKGYSVKSGTSMATPMVSGVIAMMLSDFEHMTNKDFKLALKYTSKHLDLNNYQQGWGLIDVEGLYKYFDEIYN